MKRRKWWFIGVAFVLLAATVIGWLLIDRPPYRFMADATLEGRWIRTGFGPDTAVTEYRLARPFDQVVESARQELVPLHWSPKQFGKDVAFSPHTNIDDILAESVYVAPPISAGGPVRITISAPVKLDDRAQIWLVKTFGG